MLIPLTLVPFFFFFSFLASHVLWSAAADFAQVKDVVSTYISIFDVGLVILSSGMKANNSYAKLLIQDTNFCFLSTVSCNSTD